MAHLLIHNSDNQELLSLRGKEDCTVLLNEHSWRVHQKILREKSFWFEYMFKHDEKVKRTGILTLHDDCPASVARMLIYLYRGEYPSEDSNYPSWEARGPSISQMLGDGDEDSDSDDEDGGYGDNKHNHSHSPQTNGFFYPTNNTDHIKTHLAVYEVARKYDISSLKEYSMRQVWRASSYEHNFTGEMLDRIEEREEDEKEERRVREWEEYGEEYGEEFGEIKEGLDGGCWVGEDKDS